MGKSIVMHKRETLENLGGDLLSVYFGQWWCASEVTVKVTVLKVFHSDKYGLCAFIPSK
jgi:hypothetical protein